jgi:arsenical pump membrane protein
MPASFWTWGIAGLATAGVVLRPFSWPECVWALAGAALLVAIGGLSPGDALAGAARGMDVYLFLAGMMLLAELARQEGLFDWLAAKAAAAARGSAARLFTLVFAVGTAVTVFLSNDATAVVLTPAVAAVVRTVKAARPFPYLVACAFVANAASFVLPISNPANLVVYGRLMPPLSAWLSRYCVPSMLAILATYGVLRWSQRRSFARPIVQTIAAPHLSAGGRRAAWGLAIATAVLTATSLRGAPLGLPTVLAGVGAIALVLAPSGRSPLPTLRGIAWDVLLLVAGLFVIVEALEKAGLTAILDGYVHALARHSAAGAAWAAGLALAFVSNLVNNLPAGLVAGRVAQVAAMPETVRAAALIGVDLGPNLSVTGSLATILWLAALRREGYAVDARLFLRLGALVMPPALLLALAGLCLSG